MTLAARLLLLIAVTLVSPLLIQAWTGLEQRREREIAMRVEAVEQTRAVRADMTRLVEGVHDLLVAIAQVPAVQDGNPAGCSSFLQAVVNQFSEDAVLAVNDNNGHVLCDSTGPTPGIDRYAARTTNHLAATPGGFVVGNLVRDAATGEFSIPFVLPFHRRDGAIGGTVSASLDQRKLARQLAVSGLPPDTEALLLDSAGMVVVNMHDPHAVLDPDRFAPPCAASDCTVQRVQPAEADRIGQPAPAALRAGLHVQESATIEVTGLDGKQRLFGALPADPDMGGMTVAVGVDRQHVFADLSALFWHNVLGLILGAALALAAGSFGTRRFVLDPLARLAAAADRVGRGDLGAKADLGHRVREIRDVGTAFDRMSTALAAREQERDRAEAARQAGEARLARVLATTPAGVIEMDADGRFVYANAAAERILGAAPDGLIGRFFTDPAWQPAAQDHAPIPPEALPAALALHGEAVMNYEHELTTLDGRRLVLAVDIAPVRGARDRIEGALATFQDVTARHASAAALRASEERYRTLFEAIDAGFCIIEVMFDAARNPVDYRFIEVNPAFEKQTSLVGAVGKSMRALVPAHEQHWYDIYGRVALTGEPKRLENFAEALDRWFDVQAFRIGDPAAHRIAVLFNDISERRRAEAALRQSNENLEARVAERTAELEHAVEALNAAALEREQAEEALRQSQKMEAVGQLTGGIAHDFNNMLQAIGGSLEMMQRRIRQGRVDDAVRHIGNAGTTVERAAALTHRLLAFARRQTLQPRAVEPDALIAGVVELIRRTVGPAVIVELLANGGERPVLCDPNQLENVLLNLAINARDAMPEGGRLTIRTEDVCLGAMDVVDQPEAVPGDYVEIAVADTGTGMDEDTKAHAFEPFFTTKPLGQGTGLGLSQVYGFVRQSGGLVRLHSVPGQGTTIRLYLPRQQAAAEAKDEPVRPFEPHRGRASGVILLVEDDNSVRMVTAEQLRDLGYRVEEAADGAAALRFVRSGVPLDALVTDVGLPGGVNGRQVAEAARDRWPDLPVLFITGFAGTALETQLAPGMEMISKPFTLEALAARVRAMLERSVVTT